MVPSGEKSFRASLSDHPFQPIEYCAEQIHDARQVASRDEAEIQPIWGSIIAVKMYHIIRVVRGLKTWSCKLLDRGNTQ